MLLLTRHSLGQYLLETNLTLLGTMGKSRKKTYKGNVTKLTDSFRVLVCLHTKYCSCSYSPKRNRNAINRNIVILLTMHEKVEIDVDNEAKKPYTIFHYNY